MGMLFDEHKALAITGIPAFARAFIVVHHAPEAIRTFALLTPTLRFAVPFVLAS